MSKTDKGRRAFLQRAASAAALGAAELCQAGAPGAPQLAAAPAQDMPRRELGNTAMMVPILQLGTAQRMDPRYDKVMHLCFREGVSWFDTALSYGWGASHEAIATFLEQIGDRRALWLTSKSGKRSPDALTRDLDKACAQLGTEYLDVYLMHGIDDVGMLDRTYLELGDALRRSGKTRLFGFSCHDGNVVELMNTAARRGGIDVILFRYNFRRYGDRELNLAIDACDKAGIGLLAMKTMGSVAREHEDVVDFRSKNFTLAQAKLKSVWADERIDSICSEMDNVAVTRENIAAAKSQLPLSAEETHQLNLLAAVTAAYACNGCSHLCEAAAGGDVAIAAPLRYLMYHECYGKSERARELYRAIPEHRRARHGELLQAAHSVCPQGIDIAGRLARARALLS